MKKRRTLGQMAVDAQRDDWACPRCGCRHWRVISTYYCRDGTKRRLTACRHCHYSRTTYESTRKPEG